MPYQIEIETADNCAFLIVDEMSFKEDGRMLLRNCGPADVPDSMKEIFRFHSHRLTAIIKEQDQIESLTVSTHLAEDDLTTI